MYMHILHFLYIAVCRGRRAAVSKDSNIPEE